jgi:hypothetical protein
MGKEQILIAFVGGPLNGQHHWREEAEEQIPHFLPGGWMVMYGRRRLPSGMDWPMAIYAPVGMSENAFLHEARALRAPPPDPVIA